VHRQIRRFIETYPGSSFPSLVEADDGGQWVVKLHGAGNGMGSLLNEFVVNRLCHAAGLPVPDVCELTLAPAFPWAYGTDEFHDLVRKSAGPNLGLTWIPGARPLAADDRAWRSRDLISQVVTIDSIFGNADRTPQSANLARDRRGQTWILDHGACCFLRHDGGVDPMLRPGHVFAGHESALAMEWFGLLEDEQIRQTVADVPDEWLLATGLGRDDVRSRLGRLFAR
jgi:hypothetical protein